MKKAFLAAFLALCLATFAQAQQTNGNITAAGTTCTAGVCVQIIKLPPNSGAVSFSVSGTFSATLQFEVSADGAGFVSVNAYPPNSSTAVTSTTSAGTWTVSVAGMTSFRVRGSAYASGSAGVVMNASSAVSASSLTAGGGGGGGGGPTQTCDASTIAEYAPAVCVLSLDAAQLNAFDGTSGTAIQAIMAPGSGKAILLDTAGGWSNYISSTVPFGTNANVQLGYDTAFNAPFTWSANLTFTGSSTFSNGSGGSVNQNGNSPAASNLAVYMDLSSSIAVTTGPIATSSLNTGGVMDGVNTSQITSGNAGTLWSVNDEFSLACNALFEVDTTGVGGSVATYHELSSSSGCMTGMGQMATAESGTGTGLQLDVLTIGAAYRTSDTFQDSVCATAAMGHVVSVDSNGLILTFAIDTPGAGCSVTTGDGLTDISGIGQGASIDIDTVTITAANGSAKVTIPFTVGPIS